MVLWAGVWCPGEVRMVKWVDGVELRQVQYRRPAELSIHIDTFPASQVRADTVARGGAEGEKHPPNLLADSPSRVWWIQQRDVNVRDIAAPSPHAERGGSPFTVTTWALRGPARLAPRRV